MDIKLIINSIIILFFLHIIILNINYSYHFGSKKNVESFSGSGAGSNQITVLDSGILGNNKESKENSLDFLKSNDDNDDFKKKLLKYMAQDDPVPENEFENKNLHKVLASNSYVSDNNTPNFESNVADISKFYTINYDNLDESQLKQTTSIESIKQINNKNPDCNRPQESTVNQRESVKNPDNWSYKNELPMNGGNMNGIVGFDALESQFSFYNPNKLNLQESNDNHFQNIPHDDLRKPIVYEN
jgi:hypothetical protein